MVDLSCEAGESNEFVQVSVFAFGFVKHVWQVYKNAIGRGRSKSRHVCWWRICRRQRTTSGRRVMRWKTWTPWSPFRGLVERLSDDFLHEDSLTVSNVEGRLRTKTRSCATRHNINSVYLLIELQQQQPGKEDNRKR